MPIKHSITNYTMNKAEQRAVKRLWVMDQSSTGQGRNRSYREIRKEFTYDTINGCWMGKLYSIWIGIESDGYTHS